MLIIPTQASSVNEAGYAAGLVWRGTAETAWHGLNQQWTICNLSELRPYFFAAFAIGRDVALEEVQE